MAASTDVPKPCHIAHVPFRGAPCSDAAGKQFAYKDIVTKFVPKAGRVLWDELSKSPYLDFVEDVEERRQHQQPRRRRRRQVWFDNVDSLTVKYKHVAQALGLGGVGMWAANFLDYSNATQVDQMWAALP